MSEYLTASEKVALDHLARFWREMAAGVVRQGPNREADLREIVLRVHALQAIVMSQAAARAYPGEFRLLGGSLREMAEDDSVPEDQTCPWPAPAEQEPWPWVGFERAMTIHRSVEPLTTREADGPFWRYRPTGAMVATIETYQGRPSPLGNWVVTGDRADQGGRRVYTWARTWSRESCPGRPR